MNSLFSRQARFPFGACLTAAFLLFCLSLTACRAKSEEPFVRAFTGMMQSPHRDTRLQAYFHSAGLPEKVEYVRTLRQSLSGADALERLAILYALAVMTRAPEDIDAFLDAFPKERELFYDFFDAEWDLSGTFNTGVANFLLILAYEPRTHDKALPCLARLVYTNVAGPSEFLSEYRKDPFVDRHIREHQRALFIEPPDSPRKNFSSVVPWMDFIAPLMKNDDLQTKMTAILLSGKQFSFEKTQEVLRLQNEFPPPSAHSILLEHHFIDSTNFITIFPLDAKTIQNVLLLEKQTYRPPLDGVVSTLLNEADTSSCGGRIGEILRAVRRHGNTFFEEYERQRMKRRENASLLAPVITSVSRVVIPADGGQKIRMPRLMGDAHALWAPLSRKERGLPTGALNGIVHSSGTNVASWLPSTEYDTIRRYFYRLTHDRRELTQKVPDRTEKYMAVVQEGIRGHGIPPEIACLPLVESAFEPQAMSPAGAFLLLRTVRSAKK